jgi:membrane protease YdiL (CAAX protease family)
MVEPTTIKKILFFPVTKIIIGLASVVGAVALSQWLCGLIPGIPENLKNGIAGISDALAALLAYCLLYSNYENREIEELGWKAFRRYALPGFITGLAIQSFAVLVIYLGGGYTVVGINPFSFLYPSFIMALTAGFVAEIVIRGVLFRLMEEKLGTMISLLISIILFAILHMGKNDATVYSILSVALQAGLLLGAVFVYTRSLWFSIFLHFAWDFAEPGIFGGINPGISIDTSWINSRISGPTWLSGGLSGPGSSLPAALCCLAISMLLLSKAKQRNHIIRPFWRTR